MLQLTREQILAHRRKVSALEERLPYSLQSVETSAKAGHQDSMPRAALLSIHARVAETGPETWEQPPLVQVWGLRYSVFVIAARDLALFTLGRLPDEAKSRRRAEDIAARLEAALGDARMDVRHAARLVGSHPNALRYAAPTGRFLIYWDGARQPLIWRVPEPDVDVSQALLDLLRRFLHVYGPATSESFASWAGVRPNLAQIVFDDLHGELIEVRTPIGDAWILASDESSFRSAGAATSTRLLPSGDTYYLLRGQHRELLVPDAGKRARLWTSRVWPGAVLVEGEIVGTWRRSGHKITIDSWQALDGTAREGIEREAVSMPLPGLDRPVGVTWEGDNA